jgi:Peptidase M15
MCSLTAICALLMPGRAPWPATLEAAAFEPGTADFAIAVNNEVSAYRDVAAFVLPGAAMTVQVVHGPPGEYMLTAKTGVVARKGPRTWRWVAPPQPGTYDLLVEGPKKEELTDLHVFVMVPASAVRDGVLNGYRIGQYPKALNGNPIYRAPVGFVEVTGHNENTRLSPHFRLKQFVCKQGEPGDFPKYVVLHERLMLKLEAALLEINAAGFDVDTLHVMSGYRTPYYNSAIGDVLYSLHQWGRAADVFVDKRDKGVMDDLNGDGHVDIQDSRYLYDAVERMLARPGFQTLQGGLGFYPATSGHPPFVHLDVRGTKARWQG